MTWLILTLAMAAAMALLREPLGHALVRFVTVHGKSLAVAALLLLLLWIAVQNAHQGLAAPMGAGDLAALFDSFAYTDLLIGVAVAAFNRQTRQLIGRVLDLARVAVRGVARVAGRARRTRAPARPRRAPPPDEPDPAWAFA